MTPLYNTQQVKTIEAHCLSQVPEGALIRRAAECLAAKSLLVLQDIPKPSRVLALIGPGNNGADALLCAQLLEQQGFEVECISLQTLESFDLESQGFSSFIGAIDERCLVIDGLFGIGLKRQISVELTKVFGAINRLPCKVLAVDLPSGLDANTGKAFGAALRADYTVTMLVDKVGLRTGEAAAYVGEVLVEPLGCQAMIKAFPVPPEARYLSSAWLKLQIPHRSRLAHKGSHGSVLIIGGAPGMRGAALLAALGAQAGGAGKVFLYFLAGEANDTFALSMLHPGLLLFQAHGHWEEEIKQFDAIVIGCGLSQEAEAAALLDKIMALCTSHQIPVVLDADALNLVAQKHFSNGPLSPNDAKATLPWVMTPHPLEAARLLGLTTQEVQADRLAAARSLTQKYRCAVALKGPGTVIALPVPKDDATLSDLATTMIAPFGSPALAVGGSGDVLAGLVGSLLAQGFDYELAAQMGTTIHALAGSLWSETRAKSYGLRPEELPSCIVRIMNVL